MEIPIRWRRSLLTINDDHVYRWEDEVVPGVNEIFKDVGLIDTTYFKPEHAERGKRRHKWIEDFDAGTLDWSQVDEPNYIVGWQEFLADNGMEVQAHELQVYNPNWHYAGTLDVLATDGDGDEWIVDIKTSASSYPWHRLQTTMYGLAYADQSNRPLPRLGTVYLREAKKKQFHFKPIIPYDAYVEDALGVVRAWQYKNGKWAWIE